MSDKPRAYHSPLRDQRTAETRVRIIDAAIKVLGEGAHALTIPAVAKEAGVAVPTVYRHFASKEELEDGVLDHVRELLGTRERFAGLADLTAHIKERWRATEEYPPGTFPLLMASIARNLGGDQAARRQYVEECLGADLDGLSEADRDKFVRVVQALASSPGALAVMRTGLTSDEAAEFVGWLVTTLHGALAKAP